MGKLFTVILLLSMLPLLLALMQSHWVYLTYHTKGYYHERQCTSTTMQTKS